MSVNTLGAKLPNNTPVIANDLITAAPAVIGLQNIARKMLHPNPREDAILSNKLTLGQILSRLKRLNVSIPADNKQINITKVIILKTN